MTAQNRRYAYRCEATTLEGFIQQVGVAYVARGYFFYVTGRVPRRMTASEHDERMLAKFDVARSKWSRYRRKKRTGLNGKPLANVQYIRYRDFWTLLSTVGEHRFFEEHQQSVGQGTALKRQYKDVRLVPISFGGYSLAWRKRLSVRLSSRAYRELKALFLEQAIASRSTQSLEREFQRFPYEPYGGVVRQLFSIFRAVNRVRKTAGMPAVPQDCLRLRRQVVRPFERYDSESVAVAA